MLKRAATLQVTVAAAAYFRSFPNTDPLAQVNTLAFYQVRAQIVALLTIASIGISSIRYS